MWSGNEEIEKAMQNIENSMDLSEGQRDVIYYAILNAVNNAHWAGRDWPRGYTPTTPTILYGD